VGPAAVFGAVTDLRKSLERSDADALGFYFALVDLLGDSFNTVPWEQLGAAVNDFDFEAALIELERITGELDASLSELTSDR
jgi:hypothetical protein